MTDGGLAENATPSRIRSAKTSSVSGGAAAVEICDVYNAKYRYNLEPDTLPGPFYGVVARSVFAWVSDDTGADGGAAFHGTTTRWRS